MGDGHGYRKGHTARHRPDGPQHRQRHRMRHAAHHGAAGGVAGAAVAGAVPVASHLLGQRATAKIAEEVMAGLPKNMLTGLGVGVLVGGVAGYLLADDRPATAPGRDGDDFAEGYARGFAEGRKAEGHAARIEQERHGHQSGHYRG